ncbi:MAG: VWA domain-containing protein [Thermodesulfobacteriota bacterium]
MTKHLILKYLCLLSLMASCAGPSKRVTFEPPSEFEVKVESVRVNVEQVTVSDTMKIRNKTAFFPSSVLSFVRVTDQTGNNITGLAHGDRWIGPGELNESGELVDNVWRVLEFHKEDPSIPADNRASPLYVTEITEAAEYGISVALVMDYSMSMEGSLGEVRKAANAFVDNMRGLDRVAIIKFSDYVRIMQNFTSTKSALYEAIKRRYGGGKTALNDAIYKAISETSKEAGRKAVIAYTDGRNNRGRMKIRDVINYARENAVPVFTIGLGSGVKRRDLKRIAESTGGVCLHAPTAADIGALYQYLAQAIRNYYVLAHTSTDPTQDGTWRVVDVAVNCSGLQDNDKGEYRAPGLPDLVVTGVGPGNITGIMENWYAGTVVVVVTNIGLGSAPKFGVAVYDGYPEGEEIGRSECPGLRSGEDCSLPVIIETEESIENPVAVVDPSNEIKESDEGNNEVPTRSISQWRGEIAVEETVRTARAEYTRIEIPLVPIIFFDENSSMVERMYYEAFEGKPIPVLKTLAERLKSHPEITVTLEGYIDLPSGERDRALSTSRAKAVKDVLTSFGVSKSQVMISSDHDPHRPRVESEVDEFIDLARAENRRVEMSVNQMDEEKLFGPLGISVRPKISVGVAFNIDIHLSGKIEEWRLEIENKRGDVVSTLTDESVIGDSQLNRRINWNGIDREDNLVDSNCTYYYRLRVKDRSGQNFETMLDSFYLKQEATIIEDHIFALAIFDDITPTYPFYWERLTAVAERLQANWPDLRVRFEGHTCVIGDSLYNIELSYRRAEDLTQRLLHLLKTKFPRNFESLKDLVDNPKCCGFNEPLTIRIPEYGEVLYGDNDGAQGRNLNRRIEIILYKRTE